MNYAHSIESQYFAVLSRHDLTSPIQVSRALVVSRDRLVISRHLSSSLAGSQELLTRRRPRERRLGAGREELATSCLTENLTRAEYDAKKVEMIEAEGNQMIHEYKKRAYI